MDNSISLNLEGTHSRESLTFHWKALFKDGNFINQFDEDGEHKFKEIKDKFNGLHFFYLFNKNNLKEKFIVDLENGFIYKNEINSFIQEEEIKTNIRLIYFRRHKVEIGEKDLKEKSHNITYHLGFQYNDKNGNNKQIVFQIDENGNWILG